MSSAIELFYLTIAAGMTTYIVGTAFDAYYYLTHSAHLTDFHIIFKLWALPLALLAHHKAHKAYRHARQARLLGCKPGKWLPQSDPILGTDFLRAMTAASKSNTIPELWHSWFQRMGNTFFTHAVGRTAIYTIEPENIKAILATDFENFPIEGPRLLTTLLTIGRHSIFSVNGEEWYQSRALIRPAFERNQVADLACIDRHVENFLQVLPRDGSTVELQSLLHMLSMDTSTDFMFGQSTSTLMNPTEAAAQFTKAFDNATAKAGSKSRYGKLMARWPDAEFDRDVKTIQAFAENLIEKSLNSRHTRERGYVFLDEIAKTGASPVVIRDQILGLIAGGRDTTASALSALFWHLARRPEVVEKLRKEVAELEGRKPTWGELKNMKYLNMVLKEVLRLHPPVFANSRSAGKDTTLPLGGGPDGRSSVFVPKGTIVRWSAYSLQRRKDIFGDDSEEFKPERWEKLRTSWEWVPFSGGPRICLGQQFALTEMAYTVTRIMQTFKAVEPRDEKPFVSRVRLLVTLEHGCRVAFAPA